MKPNTTEIKTELKKLGYTASVKNCKTGWLIITLKTIYISREESIKLTGIVQKMTGRYGAHDGSIDIRTK